jgi:3-hydroxyacyl-[acyl-carrier-protein] dehydratase
MYEEILNKLPYGPSFRFVDTLLLLDEKQAKGEYTLHGEASFYTDHFPGNPVTPGVIITEIMAQIGVVAMGIYCVLYAPEYAGHREEALFPLLTSSDVSFYRVVHPDTKLTVMSERQYFRFGKLKCYIEAFDGTELVARGTFAGMIRKPKKTPIEQ